MMSKIALLTDSTCDIPGELMNKLSIHFMPLKIIFNKREYQDRIDITPDEVYQKFDEEIPSTSMPNLDEFKSKFLELKEKGFTHIIAIHISSGLSSTYNIARMAGEEIEGLLVEVVDSKCLSMGLGRLVLYARELIDQDNLEFSEIVKMIKDKIEKIDLFFIVDTLKYLIEGGRIGKVKGAIGKLFNIKPIISINGDGEYFSFSKARSRKKSIDTMYKIAKKRIREGLCTVDIMHANAREEARDLLARLEKLENVKDTFFGEISPAMAVHAGPGLIGVCITKE